MDPDCFNYRFHKPLKRLIYMGTYSPETLPKPSQRRFFQAFMFFCRIIMLVTIVLQLIDFYQVLGNFKKVTFNFSTSTVVIGIYIKMMFLNNRKEKLREVQYKLWNDSIKYNDPEETAMLDIAFKKFSYIRKVMCGGAFAVIVIWGTGSYFSYMWGTRVLPFAIYIPIEDINNDVTYVPALIYEFIMAYYVSQSVLESDMMMLAILLQVETHCKILGRKLLRLNDGEESKLSKSNGKPEINERLRSDEIVRKLKTITKRHLELLEYCEDVEYAFSSSMAVQLLGGSFLILMNSVEASRSMIDLSFTLLIEIMYLIFVLCDIYIICHHFTSLATECTNVGREAYGCEWYEMDIRARRMLGLIITRAQKAPRFTYGNLFVIDVNAFMHFIKNIYSWLMLFRQLEMK